MAQQQFVSVYANGKSGTVVTVSAGHAKATGQAVLKDEPAVDKFGVPLGPREKSTKTSAEHGGSKSSKSSTGGTDAASTPEEASK